MDPIRLRNHDGSIRVLKDVRYVPKLKNNFISLRAIESNGLIVIIRDGVLNVILDARLVMKGTRKKKDLYYYNGSIVIGVVATVCGSDEDSEINSLWHRRLGLGVGVVSMYRHNPSKGHW